MNHRISESVRLVNIMVGHLVQPSCSSWVILEHIVQDCIQTVFDYPLCGLFDMGGIKTLFRSLSSEIPSSCHQKYIY